MDEGQRPQRTAFFGRRHGHKLRPRQAGLFKSLLPRLALDLTRVAPGDLAGLFTQSVDAVRLEMGFRGAEYLIADARQHPQTGFIANELFVNGMAKSLPATEAHELANVRLHHGEASAVMEWLPPASLAG